MKHYYIVIVYRPRPLYYRMQLVQSICSGVNINWVISDTFIGSRGREISTSGAAVAVLEFYSPKTRCSPDSGLEPLSDPTFLVHPLDVGLVRFVSRIYPTFPLSAIYTVGSNLYLTPHSLYICTSSWYSQRCLSNRPHISSLTLQYTPCMGSNLCYVP